MNIEARTTSVFEEQFSAICRTWSAPAGRTGASTWRVQTALLRIARRARSTVVAPGIRRIELEAPASRRTVVAALKRLEATGHIAKHGRSLRGKPQPFRLLPRRGSSDNPLGASAEASADIRRLGSGASDSAPCLEAHLPDARGERIASLAFKGRDIALRIFLDLDMELASAPRALAERLHLNPSTVRSNLLWLSRLRTDGMAWVWREPQYRGGWLASLSPTEDDFYAVAVERRTLLSWSEAWNRVELERTAFDEAFRSRFGFDRQTGEILR